MKSVTSTRNYCVYHHVIDDQVIYVGCGVFNRVISFDRNSIWHDLYDKHGEFPEIRIIRWFSNRIDAEVFEALEMHRLSPVANTQNPIVILQRLSPLIAPRRRAAMDKLLSPYSITTIATLI